MSTTPDQPLDHYEITQTPRTAAARALANLRAAMCGFTESKQHHYEGLLFQLEVGFGLSGITLERRIRHAGMLEAAAVEDDVLQIFLMIASSGRITADNLARLQERLHVPDEHRVVFCTRDHRACTRSATGFEKAHD